MNKTYDVVVGGGGISGCFAALAAAKCGRSVLLVEATDTIGGIVVEGPLEAFMTFHDQEGTSVASELMEEFIHRLMDRGGTPGYVADTAEYCRTIVPYDHIAVKLLLVEMIKESAVDILLNAPIAAVSTSNRRVSGVDVSTRGGMVHLPGSAFVDATGDSTLGYLSGAETMGGRESDGKVQPMTLLFKVAGVDTKELMNYVRENEREFRGNWRSSETAFPHLWGFRSVLHKGFQSGALSLKRDEIQAMVDQKAGTAVINYTRYQGDPLDPWEVSNAQLVTLKQAYELVEYLKQEVPGFAGTSISHTGRIGIRESRCIVGKYILRIDDIVDPQDFPDTVAQGAFPVDIHQPDGDSLTSKRITKAYNIPASVLTSADFDNLFMCGRCISATHEALSSARISATCMATGEAAGRLAARDEVLGGK